MSAKESDCGPVWDSTSEYQCRKFVIIKKELAYDIEMTHCRMYDHDTFVNEISNYASGGTDMCTIFELAIMNITCLATQKG